MKKRIDRQLITFILIGIVNTLAGSLIMFTLYNRFGAGYWLSSAANYILTSILSFFLNKYITFGSRGNTLRQGLKFVLHIALCYLVSYGLARPLCLRLLAEWPEKTRENTAMLIGMALFTIVNFLGQRFFTFRESTSQTK